MKKKQIAIGKRARLVKNLILLDGISRSGKFVLANLLNGLEDIEPVQYSGVVEHIPYLAKMGLIEKMAAEELLHHEIDLHCYEMLIGRNLNHRRSDKSSVFNVANHEALLQRAKEDDTDKELGEFYRRKRYSLFITHEALPVIDIFLDSFPDIRVVSLRRSPVDLVYAWFTRYAIDKWGSDPKFFPLVFEGKSNLMPWFMHDVAEEYEALKGADRVILMIDTLFKKYKHAGKKCGSAQKKQILFVRYEDILEHTDDVVRKLSLFLGKERTSEMSEIYNRLKLPSPNYSSDKKAARLAKIQAHASPQEFNKLLRLEKEYFSKT